MSKPIVSLVNVEKWYGTNHVVKNMNINIAEGEFLTLLGHPDVERQRHCV